MMKESEAFKTVNRLILLGACVWSLVFFIPILGSIIWKDSVANSCNGTSGKLQLVDGRITASSKPSAFYIDYDGRYRLVLACPIKSKCSGKAATTLKRSVGKSASAAFCAGELLWLDIESDRVITADHSGKRSWVFITITLCVIGLASFVAFFPIIRNAIHARWFSK